MKALLAMCLAAGTSLWLSGCGANTAPESNDESSEPHAQSMEVDFGCATCIYDMEGVTGCVLAVEIEGAYYLVDGVDIDDLGDAHAADGLCLVERRGTITGAIEGDRFTAASASLLPLNPEHHEGDDASDHQH